MKRAAVLMVSGALFFAAWPQAQTPTPSQPQPQTRPVFRTTTDVVPLTVTVLDKAGNPVVDLKASDFTILENSRPREILNFFTQAFTPGQAEASSGSLNRAAPKNSASGSIAPETRRSFLVVLGYGRIQYPTKAIDGVISFVNEHLLPQDIVAILGFDRATDFTTDHAQIVRMLDRYKQEHERLVFEINEWKQRRYTRDDLLPRSIREDIDAIFTGVPTPRIKKLGPSWSTTDRADGTMRDTVPMLLGMDAVASKDPKAWTVPPTVHDLQLDAKFYHSSLEEQMIGSSILKAHAGIEYLRYLEGEKHMLYLGNSGLVPASRGETDKLEDATFARRLNDARITLDMVHTSGPPPVRAGRTGAAVLPDLGDLVSILGFQYVAELNGGTYTGVTYADKALATVDRGSRFSYLLGYAPSNPALDGKYRNVEVKVSRPDLVIRYRHGYFASDQPDPLKLEDLITTSRLEAAVSFRGDAKDIKIDATAMLMPKLGVMQQLRVDVHIDASRLSLPPAASGKEARIELRAYVGDEKEALIGDRSEQLLISFPDEATRESYLRDGIARSLRISLSGVPKHVKIVVYDYASDLMGTFVFTMK